MRKVAAASIALGVLTASCSGGHSASFVPTGAAQVSPASGAAAAPEGELRSTRSVAAATAPAGWASTATHAFTPKNGSDLGKLSLTKTLTVRVGLNLRNAQGLQALIKSGGRISPAEFTASYGPTSAQVAQVTKYLQSRGLTNVTVEPNNLIVSATGTAAEVSAAFDTTLHAYSANGKSVYANTTPAYVPQSLSGIVVAVLGLNDVQTFTTPLHKGSPTAAVKTVAAAPAATPTPMPESPCSLYSVSLVGLPSPQPEPGAAASEAGCARNYIPSDYWRAYDAMNLPAATSVNIAIMAEGAVTPAITNLHWNDKGDSLIVPAVVVKQVGPGSSDTAGDDEWTLDMIASSGMARTPHEIFLYATTSLTDSDIALEYNRWVTDDVAPIGNSSFGGCEYGPYLDGSMVLDDEILAEGAAQGQTMFASTGDTGSFCSVGTPNGVPAGVPLVEYPAASPYVVAVGGTTLLTNTDGSYHGEVPWYSGGGGLSQFEYGPAWEAGVQPVNSAGAFTFRGVPDVSMDADLQTGMMIYLGDQGGWTTIGGTSLASPLMAGLWARMLEVKRTLGFAPPRLYAAWNASAAGSITSAFPQTQPHGPYHDLLAGGNGMYTALPGWDYASGMGSVDAGALAAALER